LVHILVPGEEDSDDEATDTPCLICRL